jgi:DNA mismatch endonuclease (patch repair protein)
MTDILTPQQRAERMSRVRGKDTKPELLVRRLVHGMGYRYRLHDKRLPGSPDLVFRSRRKVIFVHGCFWHRHPDPSCSKGRLPVSRREFWEPKLNGNQRRDERIMSDLHNDEWAVLVIWECECRRVEDLKTTLRTFITGTTAAESSG